MDLGRLDRIARRVQLEPALRRATAHGGRRRAARPGPGLALEGHRDYAFGDDVRHLDWKVTARLARPFVRLYHQERSGTVFVLVDASASMRTGRGHPERVHEAAALIILLAAYAGERVGVAQFTDHVEWVRAPRRGGGPALAAIRAMSAFVPASPHTSLATALAQAGRLTRSAATIVIVSDFLDRGYEGAMGALRRRHHLLAVSTAPPALALPPDGGLDRIRDPESGRTRWVDLRSRAVALRIGATRAAHAAQRRSTLGALGIPCVELPTERSWVGALVRLGRSL